MKKAILVALVFSRMVIVSCKKDKDKDPVTAADLITSTTWKIDTIGLDANKDGVIDSPAPGAFESCELDNTLAFSADSTGIFDEGAAKCDPADPQSTAFTRKLMGNDSLMNISGNILAELQGDVKIITITNTNFVLAKHLVSSFPIPYDINLIVALEK